MPVDVATAILNETDKRRLVKDVMENAPTLAKHSVNQHSKPGHDPIMSSRKQGTSSDYLAARIKRDRPDIAAGI